MLSISKIFQVTPRNLATTDRLFLRIARDYLRAEEKLRPVFAGALRALTHIREGAVPAPTDGTALRSAVRELQWQIKGTRNGPSVGPGLVKELEYPAAKAEDHGCDDLSKPNFSARRAASNRGITDRLFLRIARDYLRAEEELRPVFAGALRALTDIKEGSLPTPTDRKALRAAVRELQGQIKGTRKGLSVGPRLVKELAYQAAKAEDEGFDDLSNAYFNARRAASNRRMGEELNREQRRDLRLGIQLVRDGLPRERSGKPPKGQVAVFSKASSLLRQRHGED